MSWLVVARLCSTHMETEKYTRPLLLKKNQTCKKRWGKPSKSTKTNETKLLLWNPFQIRVPQLKNWKWALFSLDSFDGSVDHAWLEICYVCCGLEKAEWFSSLLSFSDTHLKHRPNKARISGVSTEGVAMKDHYDHFGCSFRFTQQNCWQIKTVELFSQELPVERGGAQIQFVTFWTLFWSCFEGKKSCAQLFWGFGLLLLSFSNCAMVLRTKGERFWIFASGFMGRGFRSPVSLWIEDDITKDAQHKKHSQLFTDRRRWLLIRWWSRVCWENIRWILGLYVYTRGFCTGLSSCLLKAFIISRDRSAWCFWAAFGLFEDNKASTLHLARVWHLRIRANRCRQHSLTLTQPKRFESLSFMILKWMGGL